MIKKIYTLFILFAVNIIYSQKYIGQIQNIEINGYYHLLLTPEMTALSKKNLSDIRIKDKNMEIPYFVVNENPIKQEKYFKKFNITSSFVKGSTKILIHNSNKENLNQFCLVIPNVDSDKFAQLKGGDNNRNWFLVKSKIQINKSLQIDENLQILIIDFPQGNYEYYELELITPLKQAIKVISVGKYQYSNILGKYSEINLGKITQKDSAKVTYISFPELKYKNYVNQLKFDINFNGNYHRESEIIENYNNSYNDNYFSISSKNKNNIEFNNLLLSDKSLIKIKNKDNPSLKIESIKAYQLNKYLCVYLEKGKSYDIYGGDSSLQAPEYDIAYFEEEISKELPVISISELTITPDNIVEIDKEREKSFIEKPPFLWSIIIIVGLFLGIICFRMLNEMKKK